MLKNKESRNENIFKQDIIDVTKFDEDNIDSISENESTKANQANESINSQDNESKDLIKAEIE